MLAAVRKAGVKHMVNFNYRRCPAVALAKQMIDSGGIGEIRHARFTYLQDWLVDPAVPDELAAAQGSGRLGGPRRPGRPLDRPGPLPGRRDRRSRRHEEDVHHRAARRGNFEGTIGNRGRGNRKSDRRRRVGVPRQIHRRRVRHVRGDAAGAGPQELQSLRDQRQQGFARVVLRRPELPRLLLDEGPRLGQGFRRIIATEGVHPFAGSWWPPGHMLGYDHGFAHAADELAQAIAQDKPCVPASATAPSAWRCLEAVDHSIDSGSWAKVEILE